MFFSSSSGSYSSGQFMFTLDGSPDPGYLKSFVCGTVKGAVIEEQIGPDFTKMKHLATVEIDPIGLELGMAVSRPMFEWIRASWTHNFQRKSGAIIHADHTHKAVLGQEFTNALIVETTFPALDATDTGSAYLNVKLHPETLEVFKPDFPFNPTITSAQKLWAPSNFYLDIDGIDTSRVSKIDSFSVKQKIKQLYMGSQRHPELEPTGLEFSNITLYTSLAYAQDFLDWHSEYVVRGDRDIDQERQGAIVFLDPKGEYASPLLTVTLHNIGIFSLGIEKSEAGAENIKRCKIELYVERMDLGYGYGLE